MAFSIEGDHVPLEHDPTWREYGHELLTRLSPKVVVPLVVLVLANTLYGLLIGGGIDFENLVGYGFTVLYFILGVGAPPAPGVTQKQVARFAGTPFPRRSQRTAHIER